MLVGDFSRRTTTSLPVEDNVKALVAAFTEQELFDDPVALPPGAMAVDKKGDPSMVSVQSMIITTTLLIISIT